MLKKAICLMLMTTSLCGCMDMGPKQRAGQLMGGVAGALIGSQIGHGDGRLASVAIGTLAGSAFGGMIGEKMDRDDRALAQRTMMSTLEHAPDNQVHSWRNPNTRHSGNFRVTCTEELPEDNLVCRDYVHTVIMDGRQEKVHGRACRDMRDRRGEWFVMD